MEIIEFIKDLSIIAASLSAIYGINSWRKEIREKKQYELAEDALALFYQARDIINYIRSPLSYEVEGKSRKQSENETIEQKKFLDQAYIVFERYNENRSVFNRLHSLKYRFMSVFGTDKVKPFNDLENIMNEIFSASKKLSRFWLKGIQNEFVEKSEAIIWDSLDDDDPINEKNYQIISEIEKTCRNIINR